MIGYNIIFDSDQNRLGFAKSDCNYEEFDEQGNEGLQFNSLYKWHEKDFVLMIVDSKTQIKQKEHFPVILLVCY